MQCKQINTLKLFAFRIVHEKQLPELGNGGNEPVTKPLSGDIYFGTRLPKWPTVEAGDCKPFGRLDPYQRLILVDLVDRWIQI